MPAAVFSPNGLDRRQPPNGVAKADTDGGGDGDDEKVARLVRFYSYHQPAVTAAPLPSPPSAPSSSSYHTSMAAVQADVAKLRRLLLVNSAFLMLLAAAVAAAFTATAVVAAKNAFGIERERANESPETSEVIRLDVSTSEVDSRMLQDDSLPMEASRDLDGTAMNSATAAGFVFSLPKSCLEILMKNPNATSGEYTIQVVDRFVHRRLHVWCDMGDDDRGGDGRAGAKGGLGGGWTLIQKRGQHNRSLDYFFRPWEDYVWGFGHLRTEFWMGLDNIQALAEATPSELLVELWPLSTTPRPLRAHYDAFSLSDDGRFSLELGKHQGDAGDAMVHNRFRDFSTYDRDNDLDDSANCAKDLTGAWWYGACTNSNLNGRNYHSKNAPDGKGIVWGGDGPGRRFDSQHSLFRVEMKIRPL